jgi:hypothetical protein
MLETGSGGITLHDDDDDGGVLSLDGDKTSKRYPSLLLNENLLYVYYVSSALL